MFWSTVPPTYGAILREGQFWPFILILAVFIYVVYDWYQKRKANKRE